MGILGIILSLAMLIYLAYRGNSVIVVAPLAAGVAILFSGAPHELLAQYTQVFMVAAGRFITNFFPLFLIGAIFGQIMSASGLARDLAAGLAKVFGAKNALLVTVLTTALLTYGGVNAWVIVFTMFPIATILFRLADLPRRLMPPALALGIFTFATAALPGAPQIHNAIPSRYLGTNTWAAPGLGIIGAILVFSLGFAWLTYRQKQLVAAGESFSDLTIMEKRDGITVAGGGEHATVSADDVEGADHRVARKAEGEVALGEASIGRLLLGATPIIVVALVNALLTYWVLPNVDTSYLQEKRFGGVQLNTVAATWAVFTGMLVGSVVAIALRPRRLKEYIEGLTIGARNCVFPIMTTASEVGYGAVIAGLAAFALIRDSIITVSDNAVVLGILSTSLIAGLTGSASGGLTITLDTFGQQLVQLAQAQGIDPALVHRTMAMASTGLDSLPHNGAIITLLLVTGLTHRESYKDIGVVTVIVPIIGVIVVAALGLTFGAF